MKSKNEALIIVDVQNDFVPGGALEVKEGDSVVPVINKLQEEFQFIVATQDYHPENHGSFATNHPHKNPGDFILLGGLNQILWPVHCVQESNGAEFHPELEREKWSAVFQKGKNPQVDSYSGFFDNARRGDTGLGDYLKYHGIEKVYVTGLALDYCVKFTALDAKSLGFDTFLVADASKAVNLNTSDDEKALEEIKEAGITVITSNELLKSHV